MCVDVCPTCTPHLYLMSVEERRQNTLELEVLTIAMHLLIQHALAYTQTQVQALNHSSIYSAFNSHISSLTFIMCTQVVILWVLMCLLDKYK